MARRRTGEDVEVLSPIPAPATTLEGREDQLIAAAMNLVERRIHEGTASSQETVHFLRLGTRNAQLERDKLQGEIVVLQARVEEMQSRQSGDELFNQALAAFKGYAGTGPILEIEDDEYEMQ